MLVILRPGIETLPAGGADGAGGGVRLRACRIIATKKLTATESTFAIVFWMNVIQLVLALAFAGGPFFVGKIDVRARCPPSWALGAAGLFAHFCLSNAFRAGDASVVVPLDFMRIPLIAVIGWWLYDEPLDVFVFAGAGLIISGILWNLRSETPPPAGCRATCAGQPG